MKRCHLITAGTGSDYRIVARVEGPGSPSIGELYRQFRETFGCPDPVGGRHPTTREVLDTISLVEVKFAAMARLKEAGYDPFCYSLASFFVQWLVTEHGYRMVPSEEFFCDD